MTSPSSSGETSHRPASDGSTGVTTPEDLSVQILNTAKSFTRWRPSYHLMPHTGWMNDPCAPGYDPDTGLYYVSFQWNPNGPDWGDICWGTATSRDLIHWEIQDQPILQPNNSYDSKGVFTGCFVKLKDGSLNYIYTSVSALPIHHTLPHQRGCETLSIATSFDHGDTWNKSERNPTLPGEPAGLDVTGWRDPFCAPWPNMSKALGLDSGTLFGVVSGGIRGVTPTTFLYKISSEDLGDWAYISPLTNFGLNFRPSRWSGDLGKNWEVTNFLTLNDETDVSISHELLIMGIEGCLEDNSEGSKRDGGPSRPSRGQLWMSGCLQKINDSDEVTMSYDFGGHLDHGCLYAANSFFDPRSQRHIYWGWITEEDLCDEIRHQQGWSGTLSMPRQIQIQTVHSVTGALVSILSSITSVDLKKEENGTFTVRTLASEPYQPLVNHLRHAPNVRQYCVGKTTFEPSGQEIELPWNGPRSIHWELECSFKISGSCSKVGVSIGHTRGKPDHSRISIMSRANTTDFANSTTMIFEPLRETFTINRPSFPGLGSALLINSSPEVAPHTLFTTRNPDTNEECTETLDIRAWRDNSVLEIFVNGRTAISTRLYAAEETHGMRFFAFNGDSSLGTVNANHPGYTELEYATLWNDIVV
ncbi:uncharacterized protein N7443_003926 [Penicillium atrosanguineum]|uniref:uncharacterized protein n=1 Tax=Penicillium atrosanguineum TaxID=1132637 RepID=UPI0023A50F94|nr:uncharacterized protein N7443_003926 [Penicillium atrosanguineum]KAJ5304266.1 hypothetical protein N7443_003926 [Penicillium atrosanguineum]